MMYCMPKVKSRVSLYFGDADEQKAIAVSCVRDNGDSCKELSDNSKQYFTTEHNKRFAMTPSSISFDLDTTNSNSSKFEILDNLSITFKSNTKLTVISDAKIKVTSKEIGIIAPIEVILKQGKYATLTCNNQIHANGNNIQMTMTQFNKYNIIMDKPMEVEFDWADLALKVLAAVAVVAVVIAVAAIGAAIAIGSVAVSDYMSGNVSSMGTFIKEGLVGMVTGAIFSELTLLKTANKSIGFLKGFGNLKGPLSFLNKLAEPVALKGWQIGSISNMTGTFLRIDPDNFNPINFVINLGIDGFTGGLGGRIGDALDSGNFGHLTKNSKWLELFSSSNIKKLFAELRDFAAKRGILTNPELSALFNEGGKDAVMIAFKKMTVEKRLEFLKIMIPGVANELVRTQAFEAIPTNILMVKLGKVINSLIYGNNQEQQSSGEYSDKLKEILVIKDFNELEEKNY